MCFRAAKPHVQKALVAGAATKACQYTHIFIQPYSGDSAKNKLGTNRSSENSRKFQDAGKCHPTKDRAWKTSPDTSQKASRARKICRDSRTRHLVL
jgi:hypothetical protein